MFHFFYYLFHSDAFQTGSNVWQWFFSILGLPAVVLGAHSRWVNRCLHCWWRKGVVPVKGTIHHVCKKHAEIHGHVH